jgi:hypothetical protein
MCKGKTSDACDAGQNVSDIKMFTEGTHPEQSHVPIRSFVTNKNGILIYAIGITFIVAVTHSCLAFVQTSQ